MLKKDAVELFKGVVRLAAALELSHPAISAWPHVLTTRQSDQVRGAALRLKKRLPPHMRQDEPASPAP